MNLKNIIRIYKKQKIKKNIEEIIFIIFALLLILVTLASAILIK